MKNKKDISIFPIGSVIRSMSGTYKVIDIESKLDSRRRPYDEITIIKDIDTGTTYEVTWHKNKCFELVNP
jgi:hypothetical protein